ncbi:hypothetical protein ABEX47_15025 [Paenibacillus ehimensis]|uniref:hypothetical protein n=1 Tax=Paenibacillus ehimensis TaxID=79264 RepID=UPI003D2B9998
MSKSVHIPKNNAVKAPHIPYFEMPGQFWWHRGRAVPLIFDELLFNPGHPRKHHAIALGYPAAGPPALRRWHLEAVRGA